MKEAIKGGNHRKIGQAWINQSKSYVRLREMCPDKNVSDILPV